ncbi:MAG: sugar phosphate permease [Betaproteobacteria bacterium]|nr:sugar phosphate permease [Betaproteobacteria bacterium]
MQRSGIEFHRPILFWVSTAALVAGVLAHIPMYTMAAPMHYRMVGMEVDTMMMVGMFLILGGMAGAIYGLMPPKRQLLAAIRHEDAPFSLVTADHAPLTRAHWKLFAVLMVALIVDIMKPATLGFVVPGMSDEYGISRQTASLLALSALSGTAIGSVLWGMIADAMGRRCGILISSLMFVGTSICGAMPSFEWNLFMCFLMGASAGGLLPIAFTLMAETVPAGHRGWMLVALGGIGTTAGYLVASLCAAWLEPEYSWRMLWFLNLPTGLALIALNRFLPESPRFLMHIGRNQEARQVLASYGVEVVDADPAQVAAVAASGGLRALLRKPFVALTGALVMCGLSWGLVNFGFLLWLPSNLRAMHLTGSPDGLLAKAAFLALPGVLLVTWLYHRWSTFKSLVLFVLITAATLFGFFLLGKSGATSGLAFGALTVVLLASVSGVIAMLIPYATEIYPLQVRGTGSGLVAGSSKLGGVAAAGLGILGMFSSLPMSALLVAGALVLSVILLALRGVETRGRGLEEIAPGTPAQATAGTAEG